MYRTLGFLSNLFLRKTLVNLIKGTCFLIASRETLTVCKVPAPALIFGAFVSSYSIESSFLYMS